MFSNESAQKLSSFSVDFYKSKEYSYPNGKDVKRVIGLAVGVVAGGVQFWLLSKFTKLISTGQISKKCIAFGLLQFFMPMGVLVGTAFIIRQDLMWAGIGIAASLLIGAVISFVFNKRKLRGREDTDA